MLYVSTRQSRTVPQQASAEGLPTAKLLKIQQSLFVVSIIVFGLVYRPRFDGHRVDGNRLARRLTGILGDTKIAAPPVRIDPGASTALDPPAGSADGPHAARSRSWARTCAGV